MIFVPAWRGGKGIIRPAAVGAPAGDFPVLETFAVTNTSDNNVSVNMPSGIENGDLLIVFAAGAATSSVALDDEDFISLHNANNASRRFAVWRYTADGNEGATISGTTGNAMATAWVVVRVSGWTGTPELAHASGTSSENADPPNLEPTTGMANYLWLAAAGTSAPGTSVTYPTNYTEVAFHHTGVASSLFNAGCTVAERSLAASAENPGPFTHGGTTNWNAVTVAVQGAS